MGPLQRNEPASYHLVEIGKDRLNPLLGLHQLDK
jgi:hypothetical protein